MDNNAIFDFFLKQKIPPDEQDDFRLSLVQKVAKSGCIVKAHLVFEKIMSARNKLAQNMYYSKRYLNFVFIIY